MTSLAPITEDDIAEFLVQTPEFFERHAELLASVRLSSPHGGRAISLQERQAEMLREKIKLMEQRLMEFVRYGNQNVALGEKMQSWMQQLFSVRADDALPAALLAGVQSGFNVPQAALRLWDLDASYADATFCADVDAEVRKLVESLAEPYCGVNTGFDVVRWLPRPSEVASLALIPLRAAGAAFGLLVLASPDAARYEADMATDYLERMGALASAALARLRAA